MHETPPSVDMIAQHGEFLRRLSLRLHRDPHAADDVVQETWLKSLRQPGHTLRNPRAWFATVLRNTAWSERRARQRRTRREEAQARTGVVASTLGEAERRETIRAVSRALDALPAEQREVLLLRFYEDLPPRAIAARVGVSVNTVKSRLRLALARMRTLLAEQLEERREGGTRLGLLVGIAATGTARARDTVPLGGVGLALVGALVIGVPLAILAGPKPQGNRAGDTEQPQAHARHATNPAPMLEVAGRPKAAPAAGAERLGDADGEDARPLPERMRSSSAEGARVHVVVRDVAGRPVPEAHVTVLRAWRGGHASDPVLHRGRANMSGEAWLPGATGVPRVLYHVWHQGRAGLVMAPSGQARVAVELGEGLTVRGRCESARGVAVVATVTANLGIPELVGGYGVRTSDDGRFALPPFPRNRVRDPVVVLGEAAGWQAARATVDHETLGREAMTLVFERGVELRGTVSDERGTPLVGARVEVGRLSVRTDGQGRFALKGVPQGARSLLVRAVHHAPTLVPVPGGRAEQVDLGALVLVAGRTLRGRVGLENGASPEGVFVVARLRPDGAVVRRVRVDWKTGTFALPHVALPLWLELEPDSRRAVRFEPVIMPCMPVEDENADLIFVIRETRAGR